MNRSTLLAALLLFAALVFLIALYAMLRPGPTEDTRGPDAGQYEATTPTPEGTTSPGPTVDVLPNSGGPR